MTIACTRCGASEPGEIILPVIAFKFKHNKGCGHGIGPLAKLPGTKKIPTIKEDPLTAHTTDVKVEKEVNKDKPIVEKLKVFGQNTDTTTTNTSTTSTASNDKSKMSKV